MKTKLLAILMVTVLTTGCASQSMKVPVNDYFDGVKASKEHDKMYSDFRNSNNKDSSTEHALSGMLTVFLRGFVRLFDSEQVDKD